MSKRCQIDVKFDIVGGDDDHCHCHGHGDDGGHVPAPFAFAQQSNPRASLAEPLPARGRACNGYEADTNTGANGHSRSG